MTKKLEESQKQEIREVVADILEIELDELTEKSLFTDDHGADSLRAVEILAVLERQFGVRVPQEQMGEMIHMASVFEVVNRNLPDAK